MTTPRDVSEERSDRRRYESPRLTSYGKLTDLTANVGALGQDAQAGSRAAGFGP